jgi:tRNA-specific 2-thiouridylase
MPQHFLHVAKRQVNRPASVAALRRFCYAAFFGSVHFGNAMSGNDHARRPKAILLFSGGLDSSLACEVLRRADVEVIALRHYSIFYPPRAGGGYVPPGELITREISDVMVQLVKSPRYGHGKNANPCLDCKQMMYERAWAEAQQRGADFIATGEVLGQRPMSQHKEAFRRMEKGAGVEGLVVRPLSGQLLPPTIPEQKGLIRRADLLDIRGRSRRRQIELAAQWGIKDYPSPAGGCLLTDPQYAERVFLLRDMGLFSVEHLRAARRGRLFPLGERAFVLVGRNDQDNRHLLADAPDDALILELREHPGPLAALAGEPSPEELIEAKRLVVRYSRFQALTADDVAVRSVDEARALWR